MSNLHKVPKVLQRKKKDENEEQSSQAEQNRGKMSVESLGVTTRRAALGDVGNRVRVSNAIGDISKKTKQLEQKKEVKARVDTRWKKGANPLLTKITSTALPQEAVRIQVNYSKNVTCTKTASVASLIAEANSKTNSTASILPIKGIPNDSSKADIIKHSSVASDVITQEKRDLVVKTFIEEKRMVLNAKKHIKAIQTSVSDNTTADIIGEPEVLGHSTMRLESRVDNIDKNDTDNLPLVSEYVHDIYSYLNTLERKYQLPNSFLNDQVEMTPKMRAVLIDWINEVHRQFHMVLETFYMTVSIIDRYFNVVKTTKRTEVQLVGVTAMFIASKYEELYPPEVKDLVYITDDTYNDRQIFMMERKMLKMLGFEFGAPLPIHFLRRHSKAAHSSDTVHMMAKYNMELASCDYSMTEYLPSKIAAASLLLALHLLHGGESFQNIWNTTLQHYSKYSEAELKPLAYKLAALLNSAPTNKLSAVYAKYGDQKYLDIANAEELRGPVMDKLLKNINADS